MNIGISNWHNRSLELT